MKWCLEHGMGKNYPTYIRKAKRSGVTVRFSKDVNEWELFTKYLQESSDKRILLLTIHNTILNSLNIWEMIMRYA